MLSNGLNGTPAHLTGMKNFNDLKNGNRSRNRDVGKPGHPTQFAARERGESVQGLSGADVRTDEDVVADPSTSLSVLDGLRTCDDMSVLSALYTRPDIPSEWVADGYQNGHLHPFDVVNHPKADADTILAALEEEEYLLAGEVTSFMEATCLAAVEHPAANDQVFEKVAKLTAEASTLRGVVSKTTDEKTLEIAHRRAANSMLTGDVMSVERAIVQNPHTSAGVLSMYAHRYGRELAQNPNTRADTLNIIAGDALDGYGVDNVSDRVREAVMYRIAVHPNTPVETVDRFGGHESANVRLAALNSPLVSMEKLGLFAEFDPSPVVRDRAATVLAVRDMQEHGFLKS